MRVLIATASKHGATAEIGQIVAAVLREAGHEVATSPPESVETIDDYDAVVLGSAVYAGRWLDSARAFVTRHDRELAGKPVWLFSSGPIGDPPLPAGDAPEPLAIAHRIGAREHRTFGGRIDRSGLGLMERAITRVLKAPDGDFRDVAEIRAWATTIAAALTPELV